MCISFPHPCIASQPTRLNRSRDSIFSCLRGVAYRYREIFCPSIHSDTWTPVMETEGKLSHLHKCPMRDECLFARFVCFHEVELYFHLIMLKLQATPITSTDMTPRSPTTEVTPSSSAKYLVVTTTTNSSITDSITQADLPSNDASKVLADSNAPTAASALASLFLHLLVISSVS